MEVFLFPKNTTIPLKYCRTTASFRTLWGQSALSTKGSEFLSSKAPKEAMLQVLED